MFAEPSCRDSLDARLLEQATRNQESYQVGIGNCSKGPESTPTPPSPYMYRGSPLDERQPYVRVTAHSIRFPISVGTFKVFFSLLVYFPRFKG